ncbi:MAG: glycosyltransferase family 2 protein [Ginsengibacter sp.]
MDSVKLKKDSKDGEGLVSVIISTYNRSFLLEEAIQSVINQSYRPVECVIVDDGSTDDSKNVVENLKKKNDSTLSIIYLYQDNSGPQVARNTGTKASTGEYIQYLDSDDILYPEKLSEQVRFLKLNKDCDGVFGDWEVGTSDEKKLVTACREENMISQMLVGRCIANFSFLMRRSIVERIGDWDLKIKRNQEIDFHLTGLLKGAQFDYQPLTCGLWRTHLAERIGDSKGLAELLVFFKKWEIILKEENIMNQSLQFKLGNVLMWHIHNSAKYNEKDLLAFLKKAVSLNPYLLGFNESKKIKVLNKVVGKNLAFKIWSSGFRKTVKMETLQKIKNA